MDTNKAIEILEALASGCSPITGEIIDNDSVLNERVVIRALQMVIDQLNNARKFQNNTEIDEIDIKTAIKLFSEHERNATANSLACFFLGIRKFKNENIVSNSLYGKFKNVYSKGQLLDFFNQYLSENQLINRKNFKNRPFQEIDFFRKEKFNSLSEKAIHQLKEKINELGVIKTENLSEYVQNARINYPRAYESWSDTEKELLSKAIKCTNDLDLLSECFQRGKGSIESCGQQLIYESQNLQDDRDKN